jgi:ATP synthase protein I
MFHIQREPIRTVLRWQLLATVAIMAIAAYLAGLHGAVSAFLGGAVSIAAGVVFVFVASLGQSKSDAVEATLMRAMRAEAAKIGAVVVLLWLVFAIYTNLVAPVFLGAFIVTVVIFSLAFFARQGK